MPICRDAGRSRPVPIAISSELPALPTLFDPIRLGAILARNRILMAPLTRGRGTMDHVPTSMMIDYYRQRAGAGLILTEATGISAQGLGWPHAPGIWSAAQVEAWRPITAAVHQAGGLIFSQLWHMGRLVHPSLPGRGQPISSSATTMTGLARTYEGKQPHVQARAMTAEDIRSVLGDYRTAALNARAAGFDGVEIHAANGYLIDQFLRDNANFRDDAYGGSIENRIRFLIEVTETVVEAVGADRTAVRLSPNEERQGVNDSNPGPLFEAAATALSKLGIAFLEVREPGFEGTNGRAERPPIAPRMHAAFDGPFVLNSDYDGARAQAALDAGEADAVSFGRPFIANPDLPARLAKGMPLAADEMATWYEGGKRGYIDYGTAT